MTNTYVGQIKLQNEGLITKDNKKRSKLINDCENIITYWEESTQDEGLAEKCDSFHNVHS